MRRAQRRRGGLLGSDGSGNLGDGHTDPTQAPVAVTGLADAKAVSAGTSASCAVRTCGGVVCWGDNSTGQLGDGGAEPSSSVPVSVSGLSDATHIAAGSDFACATRTGGGVACWGANTSGNLGFAGGNSFVPVAVGGLTDTSQISTGNGFACAVRTGGGVDCWGDNSTGQLGDGGAEPASAVPVAVSGLNDAAQISAGNGFACALRSGGAVRCWGDNSTGQLGNGTTIPSNVPVTVSGIVHATSIAAGDGFACATQTGGGALCWGDNTSGELGNGSTTSSTVPVSVSGLNDAKQVATTASARTTRAGFACAVRTGGGTACWGDNSAGELGNGAAWSDVPVTVAAPKAAIAPANTVPPSVLALTTPTVGGPLFCDAGVWSAPVASIGYVWLRNGTTIPGATSAVYTTTTYDTDTGLACRVTATNSAGSATATSDAVLVLASPPFNTAPPVIHSPTALLVGAVLSCTPGSWSDPAAIITYAWLRDGAPSSPRLVRPARSPRPIGAPPSPVK